MNARLSLLKQKFPNIVGLKNVVSVRTCGFSDESGEDEFVQILNCFGNHWICITKKNCKQNEVKVYDSMYTGDLWKRNHYFTSEDIKKILIIDFSRCSATARRIRLWPICPCIQFLLVLWYRSSKVIISPGLHYLRCLKSKEITDFPHDKIMKNPGKSLLRRVKVYCTCRLPDTGDSMVQCSKCLEWFHQTCLENEWEDDKPLPKLWYCLDCR